MEDLVQLSYSVDTFYFLVMGVLVMFMAPGFAMLEAAVKECHLAIALDNLPLSMRDAVIATGYGR